MSLDNVAEVRTNLTPLPCRVGDCDFIASHIRRLVVHISSQHGRERGLLEPCYVVGCAYRFRNANTLRYHFKSYHKDVWGAPLQYSNESRCQALDVEDAPETVHVDEIDPHVSSHELFNNFSSWLRSESLQMRLSIEHVYSIPAYITAMMHQDFQNFVVGFQDRYQFVLRRRINEMGLDDGALLTFLNCSRLGEWVATTKTQAKHFFHKSKYIAPKAITLVEVEGGAGFVAEADSEQLAAVQVEGEEEVDDPQQDPPPENVPLQVLMPVSNTMHYVSILATLQQYLTHDDVVDNILSEERDGQGLLKKYNCGSFYHAHPVFKDNVKALRLIVYMDEFEACNPLGSSRGLHKIFAVYFSVGNLEQRHLSDLSCVHLALLCEDRSAKKYTYAQVLAPLVTDLNSLSNEGITVTTRRGDTHHWVGGVAFVAGDSKSQHAIGGFRGTFSSGRVCRFCMADYSQLETLLSEKACVLRSPAVHALHVQYVQEDPSQIPVYGVTGPSAFANLLGGLPNEMLAPDILHDAMEGLLTLHLHQLIRSLHDKSILELPMLIEVTSKFQYGRNDKRSKPREIPSKLFQKNYRIVGSATQMWTLFSAFPLAVGPHVPEEDPHWELFLLAHKICDIVFAPVIQFEWLPVLRDVVEQHHSVWVQLYPGTAVYKWHVFLHYARLMCLLGPVRHLWTMRFEAFHQFFIRSARKHKNFRNITKSLTERFQRRACLRMAQENILPPKFKALGKETIIPLKYLPGTVSATMQNKVPGLNEDSDVCSVRSATCLGMKCCVSDFVIIMVHGDGTPTFLKIEHLFLLPETLILVGHAAYVMRWVEHLHSYAVHVSHAPEDIVAVKMEEVVSPQTLDGYTVNGCLHIKLKFSPAALPHRY